MAEDRNAPNPDWVTVGPGPDYSELFTPPPVHNPVHTATHEQAKPLMKLLKRMLAPKHPKTKRFTKHRQQRKNRKQTYF
jgi:hypothetical protein